MSQGSNYSFQDTTSVLFKPQQKRLEDGEIDEIDDEFIGEIYGLTPPSSPAHSSPHSSPVPIKETGWTILPYKKPQTRRNTSNTSNIRKIIHDHVLPIWTKDGAMQGSRQTRATLAIDTQSRKPSPNQYNISPEIKQIYAFMESPIIQKILTNVSTCTAASRASRYAFNTCCGFTAPVMAGLLFINNLDCKQNSIDIMEGYDIDNFMHRVDRGFIINKKYDGDRESIYMTGNIVHSNNIYKRVSSFYTLISGYAHFANIGWNVRCPTEQFLKPGINLVSILTESVRGSRGSRGSGDSCSTYHHFIVYWIENMCIFFDSWAGGSDGCRESWTRIMRKKDAQLLFERINTASNAETRTSLFKRYFNAPDTNNTLLFNEPFKIGILNGTILNNYLWKYLYGIDSSGNASRISGPPTQELLKKIGFGIKTKKRTKRTKRNKRTKRTKRTKQTKRKYKQEIQEINTIFR